MVDRFDLTGVVAVAFLQPHFFRDNVPGDHGTEVLAFLVVDGGDEQIELFFAERNHGTVRQIAIAGQQPPRMLRILVEHVNALPQHFVCPTGQKMLNLFQRFGAGRIDILDHQISVSPQDVNGDVLQHATLDGQFVTQSPRLPAERDAPGFPDSRSRAIDLKSEHWPSVIPFRIKLVAGCQPR